MQNGFVRGWASGERGGRGEERREGGREGGRAGVVSSMPFRMRVRVGRARGGEGRKAVPVGFLLGVSGRGEKGRAAGRDGRAGYVCE